MAQVQLDRVSKVFPRGVRAVDGLSLEVRDGELLVLVGPSGCGKSTTLRLIAGLEQPTAGEIRIGGQRVNDLPSARRDVAMVFQHDGLLPHLNVRRNIGFGLQLAQGGWLRRLVGGRSQRAISQREIDERVDLVAEQLSIESLLDRRPRELSGGQRQRVALGRAMVRRPRVFLLDEPLSHLDAQLRGDLRSELKHLHARLGATMLYVTHDQHEAMTLADRIALMDRGRIWQTAEPLELYDRPRNRVVAGFFGNPPMNFIEGQWLADGENRLFRSECLALEFLQAPQSRLDEHLGKSVVLGVRPEHLHVAPISMPSATEVAGGSLAMIDMVEALGDSTILRLRPESGGKDGARTSNLLASKLMGRTSLRAGDRVEVVIDPTTCHWFHAATGENLIGAG